ncbi:hypothetical protein C8R45DRAFT_1220189 [Mycena sanguinolenta]|nr:hypothetical protein C8R45DRAFT_1220189 [Mycena sanguinolenta]
MAPFTDDQLDAAGLRGEGEFWCHWVSELVIDILKMMQEYPDLIDFSIFALECINNSRKSVLSPASTASPTFSEVSSFSQLSFASDFPAVTPYNLSEWEKQCYYNGISDDPPELLYRSDVLDRPFHIPEGRFSEIPSKTVYGVFNTPLNAVWDTVAPQICELLKTRKIRYSALKTARFLSQSEGQEDSFGPIVIWIATHPRTTTAENAHDVSPDILAILEANGVKGTVVEWYEGSVERLSGPHLLPVTDTTHPTHHLRRFLTAALGMPIATAEMEAADVQGSVALFFHENKDKHGADSSKVFGISNCHVLRKDTTLPYEFKGAGALPQHVRLAGFRRFQRGLDEITASLAGHAVDAKAEVADIVALQANSRSQDPEDAAADDLVLAAHRMKLEHLKNDMKTLEDFYKVVNTEWADLSRRNIGRVDWAPEISVDVQGRKYTKDIGTFEVDSAKFQGSFKGNVVDLGSKFTRPQLTAMFYPQSSGRTTFKYPPNRQLRINGCLSRELLATPDCYDDRGEPCLIVMKDGSTTDLTVGRPLAIYNYDKRSGTFAAHGDSGSLIFDGEGHMAGILHSGMPRGISDHVTFATPAWWALEQIKIKYPFADFNRTKF